MPLHLNKIHEVLAILEKKYGFASTFALTEYNPMEEFISYVTPKEIVHSKIIAELLNPNGPHGMGEIFIKAFLQKLGWLLSENSEVNVKTEYIVSGKYKTHRRIDILVKIHDHEDRAIIIENKLNGAEYQPHQLEDYHYAIQNEGLEPNNIKVVCLHLKEETECNSSIHYFTAGKLAQIINEGVNNTQEVFRNPYIIAYSKYLENLNTYNLIMNHSRLLADETKISNDQFKVCQALYDAFKLLPKAFSENLLIELNKSGNTAYWEYELEEGYDEYVAVWTKKMWNDRKGDCWISVGFNLNEVLFYLVGYDEIPYAESCDFTIESSLKHRKWYRPINEEDRVLKFEIRPNYKKILERVNTFIQKVERIIDTL